MNKTKIKPIFVVRLSRLLYINKNHDHLVNAVDSIKKELDGQYNLIFVPSATDDYEFECYNSLDDVKIRELKEQIIKELNSNDEISELYESYIRAYEIEKRELTGSNSDKTLWDLHIKSTGSNVDKTLWDLHMLAPMSESEFRVELEFNEKFNQKWGK